MLSTPMRPLACLLVALSFATLAAGCTEPCTAVQQALCSCEGLTQEARNDCEDDASAQESLDPPDADDQAVCEQLLPDCEALLAVSCDALQTPEGKRACGLAID